jgi:phage-related protein
VDAVTTATFPTSPSPDWGYVFEAKPRLATLQYGDGYKARYADGLNFILRKTTLTYSNLYTTEKDILKIFLETQNGELSFFWQPYADKDRPLASSQMDDRRDIRGALAGNH